MHQVLEFRSRLAAADHPVCTRALRDWPEARVIELAQSDDAQLGFGELARRNALALRRYTVRLCNSLDQAEEVAQATLETAFTHIQSFKGRSRFSTWLFAIAYREFLKAIRNTSSHQRVKQALHTDCHSFAVTDPDQSLDIAWALDQLSADERQCVELCAILGQSHREASVVLAMPVGTIKSHVSRARAKLNQHLDLLAAG